MNLKQTLGLELPIIQAPMAGVQGPDLAVAVSEAGALGSLPCAMLGIDAMREQLQAIRSGTGKPCNVNFFCHHPPTPDPAREAVWRGALAPYYAQFGIDPAGVKAGPGRVPFNAEAATLLEEFRPAVVSFHFGLPDAALLRSLRRWAMVDWVEKGEAPKQILARGTTVFPGRSRPLCPHPQYAHYKGTGSIEEATSFECR